jgi:hypothetical protein
VSSHVARLITIHRPESRRLILAPIGPVPFLCCSFLRCVPFLCCSRLPLAGLRKHAIEVSQRDTFAHLGVFSDLIDHARSGVLRETGQSCGDHLLRIRDLLAVENVIPVPRDLRVESTWTKQGLRCEEVSWSVGYGPRTFGWVMKPEGSERLPGVLALHGHDGVKFYGWGGRRDDDYLPPPIRSSRRTSHLDVLSSRPLMLCRLARSGSLPSSLPLFVQFDSDDDLFSLEGMQAADRRLRDHYHRAGRPRAYEGRFYPGPHRFDLAMQAQAKYGRSTTRNQRS